MLYALYYYFILHIIIHGASSDKIETTAGVISVISYI